MRKKLSTFIVLVALLLPALARSASFVTDTYEKVTSATLQNAAAATGVGTSLDVSGYSVTALEVTISNTATVTFQGLVNATWVNLACAPFGGGATATAATATGSFRCITAGLQSFRANITAYTSGTVTVVAFVTTAAVGQTDTVASTATTNLTGINGAAPLTGNGVTGTGSPRVTVASDNTPFPVKTDQTTHGTTDLVAADLTKVGGTATVTGGVNGSQGVGGLAATNAAVAGNPIYNGGQAMTDGTPPTAVTGGNLAPLLTDRYGRLLVSTDHPKRFNCSVVNNAATSLTAFGSPCAAPGAGLSLYITDITASSSVIATVTADQYLEIKSGTGGTCGTGTAVVWAAYNLAFAPIAANFIVPIKVTANNELCWMHAATGSKTFIVQGYIAP